MNKEIIDYLNEGIISSDAVFILSNLNKESEPSKSISHELLKRCSKWRVDEFKNAVEEFITSNTLRPCRIISTINSITIFMISKKLKVDELKVWIHSTNPTLRAFSSPFFIKYYLDKNDQKANQNQINELYDTLITSETNDIVRLAAIQALCSLDIIIKWRFELFEILVNYLELYKDLNLNEGDIAIKTSKFFLSSVGLVLGSQHDNDSNNGGNQFIVDQASSATDEDKTPFDLLMKISSVEIATKAKQQNGTCLVSLSLGIFNGSQTLPLEKKEELSKHLIKNLEYQLPLLSDKVARGSYFMSVCCYLTDADQESVYQKNQEKITTVANESLDTNKVDFLHRQNKVVGCYIRDNVDKVIEYLERFSAVHSGEVDSGADEEQELNVDYLNVYTSILINTNSKLFVDHFYPILLKYVSTFKKEHISLDDTPELFEIYRLVDKEHRPQVVAILNIHEYAISTEIACCLEGGFLDDILNPMEFYLQLMTVLPDEAKSLYMTNIENHCSSFFVILFEDFRPFDGSVSVVDCGGLYNDYDKSDRDTIDALFDNFLLLKSQTCTTKESKAKFYADFSTQPSRYCKIFKKYFEL